MPIERQRGFTLIELIVALAIASILLGLGVPSFTSAVQNSRINAQYNQLARSFFYARSEAVKSSEFVVVCARAAPGSRQCGTAADWANGWIVFVDAAGSVGAAAEVADGDTIISLEPALSGENTVSASAALTSGGDPQAVGHVRYRPNGGTDWQGGSVTVCDTERGAASSRVLNVGVTGSVQPGRPSGDESVPRDAFGALLDCAADGSGAEA